MTAALQQRLDQIMVTLDDPRFLESDGLGNEIGFWIFDYPADQELMVREHIAFMQKKLTQKGRQFQIINLFEVAVAMLEARNLLNRSFEREKQVGPEKLLSKIKAPLSQDKMARYIDDHFDLKNQEFVFVTGLGSAWPMVRGHEILSSMQDVMGSTPMLMFYPGEYSGMDLHLFGKIDSHNYYRAFKLFPNP